MLTGIFARRKELEIMGSIDMTRKQERKLIAVEGLTGISGGLAGTSTYMLHCYEKNRKTGESR